MKTFNIYNYLFYIGIIDIGLYELFDPLINHFGYYNYISKLSEKEFHKYLMSICVLLKNKYNILDSIFLQSNKSYSIIDNLIKYAYTLDCNYAHISANEQNFIDDFYKIIKPLYKLGLDKGYLIIKRNFNYC